LGADQNGAPWPSRRAATLALVVVGQMIGSLTFDHLGLLGLPQHSASPVRLARRRVWIVGVVLVRM